MIKIAAYKDTHHVFAVMALKRKTLKKHCLDLGYRFEHSRSRLSFRTLHALEVLERIWNENRDPTIISDQDVEVAYVSFRQGIPEIPESLQEILFMEGIIEG